LRITVFNRVYFAQTTTVTTSTKLVDMAPKPNRVAKKDMPGGQWPANFPWHICGQHGCQSQRAAQDQVDWPRHYGLRHPGVVYNANNLILCTFGGQNAARAARDAAAAAAANTAPAAANTTPATASTAPNAASTAATAIPAAATTTPAIPAHIPLATRLRILGYEDVSIKSTLTDDYVEDNTVWWCEHCYCNIGNLPTTIEHIADVHDFKELHHDHVRMLVVAAVKEGHDVTDLDPTVYDPATGKTWVLVGKVKTA
jgi:hypothetical protein